MEMKNIFGIIILAVTIALFFILNDYIITLAVLFILLGVFAYVKRIDKRIAAAIFIIFFIFSVGYFYYYSPSLNIAKGQGTVLSDNWFEALNWIRENTPECTVVATYWDPGHFITGIARRAVVFDGASQGSIRTVVIDGQNVTTGRIQDIGMSFYTDNETLSMNLMKKYRKPCGEMYYIASSDLVGKSVWWSYFATWDPVNKGKQSSYAQVGLSQARPIIGQNATAYIYPVGNQQIVIRDENGQLTPFLQQGTQLAQIEKIIYYRQDGSVVQETFSDAQMMGTILLEPYRQYIFYMPPELENSMFTRMFFFNGAGLENFEFVRSWGGEVKLFKIKFDDTPQNATFLGKKLECCLEEHVNIHGKDVLIRNATVVNP